MNKFFTLFSILFLFTSSFFGQTAPNKILNGKVVASYKDLEGIYIINQKTEKATVTKEGGYFSISVAVGDTLMFSAVQFKALKIPITEKELNKDLLLVHMEILMRNLNEVMIMQYKNINAVALGIISKDVKSYTPAERKLKAASSLDLAGNTDGTTGGSFSVDPLFNLFSGRTAMLKKELVVEHKETWLKQIDDLYSDDIFIKKLKITAENIKGFKYYLVENEEFVGYLKIKNRTMSRFLMGELAVKYNQILENEKK